MSILFPSIGPSIPTENLHMYLHVHINTCVLGKFISHVQSKNILQSPTPIDSDWYSWGILTLCSVLY